MYQKKYKNWNLFFLDDNNDEKPPTFKINKMFGEQREKNANDNKIKVLPQTNKIVSIFWWWWLILVFFLN